VIALFSMKFIAPPSRNVVGEQHSRPLDPTRRLRREVLSESRMREIFMSGSIVREREIEVNAVISSSLSANSIACRHPAMTLLLVAESGSQATGHASKAESPNMISFMESVN
jgi:hypothetical protein